MIEEEATGCRLFSKISPVSVDDIRSIGEGWKFPWSDLLRRYEVFKLVAVENPGKIPGLMSIERHSDHFVEVHQLESSPQNVGRAKRYRGIPGNLLASAARLSFDLGIDGFVQLVAKTNLIPHYVRVYGFTQHRNSSKMILDTRGAISLIAIFLKES